MRGLLDPLHGIDRIADDFARLLGGAGGITHHHGRGLCALGRVLHRGGDLVESGRGFLERGCLLFGTLGEIVGGDLQFAGARIDRVRGGANVEHGGFEGRQRHVDVALQVAEHPEESAVHALRQVAVGKFADDTLGFGHCVADTGQKLVDGTGEAVEVFVLVVLGDAAREVARGGGLDDACDGGLQIGTLGAQGFFLGVDATVVDGVFAEHLDRGRHLSDLVRTARIGHFRVEITLDQPGHRVGDVLDRLAQVTPGNERGNGHADGQSDQTSQSNHDQHGGLELGDIGLDGFEVVAILTDDFVDFGLECLAVGAVVLVVALQIGCFGRNLSAKPRGFRTELAEALRTFNDTGKRFRLLGGNERRPAGKRLVDPVEILENVISEFFSLVGGRRHVDATRIHHHRGHLPVQVLAQKGALGGVFVPL